MNDCHAAGMYDPDTAHVPYIGYQDVIWVLPRITMNTRTAQRTQTHTNAGKNVFTHTHTNTVLTSEYTSSFVSLVFFYSLVLFSYPKSVRVSFDNHPTHARRLTQRLLCKCARAFRVRIVGTCRTGTTRPVRRDEWSYHYCVNYDEPKNDLQEHTHIVLNRRVQADRGGDLYYHGPSTIFTFTYMPMPSSKFYILVRKYIERFEMFVLVLVFSPSNRLCDDAFHMNYPRHVTSQVAHKSRQFHWFLPRTERRT